MNIKQSIESGKSVRVDISTDIMATAKKIGENKYEVLYTDNCGESVSTTTAFSADECISAMEEVAPIHEWK